MSRITLTLVLVAGLAIACTRPGLEEKKPAEVPAYPAAAFFDTVTVIGNTFSHDEQRLLVTSDETGIFNVYSQAFSGGEPTQLTESTTDSTFGVSWFPADDRFLYHADQGGNELDHLFVHEEDGRVVDLTPGEGLKATFEGWSGDKKSFYVGTNERDESTFDVYRYAVDGYERTRVFENDGRFFPGPVSDDGRWLALQQPISSTDSDVWVANLGSGELTHVTPHEGSVEHGIVTFTPDSTELYYSTNEHGEFDQVWSFDVKSGERKPVVEADWDVWTVYFSEEGRYRVTMVNEDASTAVTILDTQSGEEVTIPGLPTGDLDGVNFARSETRLAFYLTRDRAPADLWVYDLTAEGEARQLTHSLNPQIDAQHLVGSEVVRYPSWDGLEIPAILWRPHGATADSPVPAIVSVHGGPGGQSRRTYNPTTQYLVNHGYAVLAVNNRGSGGYGKTFYHMDDRKHGDVDLKDCVAARGYLEGLDWVDGNRVAIMGGSYGGYMVGAALAFAPEAFDAGIDIFGVMNWVRTLESMPAWWGAERDALFDEMGNPTEDRERLERISPLYHAENIVRPLLVVQGANDPRVLQVESDEIVEKVKANGIPVEYVIFDDEGHGFTKKKNRIEAAERYREFLDRHLEGAQDVLTATIPRFRPLPILGSAPCSRPSGLASAGSRLWSAARSLMPPDCCTRST
jgi:dipeptidyl aminopeptidase/acylaminoacyl peptidase